MSTTSISEIINTVSDIVTAAVAIIGLALAIKGLEAWKEQLRGKTEYEIARQYLKASLKLRDSIRFVRNPFISVAEMQSALKDNGFKEDEYSDTEKTNQAVYSVRWKRVQEAWSELEAVMLEAEVSWGVEAVDASKDLLSLTKELLIELQMYLGGTRKKINDQIIYHRGNYDKPDEFFSKVILAIDNIKIFLKLHL